MAKFNKVIIIGGGISGKLTSRVLSDFFKEVVLLERDKEPQGPNPRKGARQGEHLHALLHAGQDGLEELFPGITERFYSSGAIKINSTRDLSWYHHGVWKLRYDGGYTTTLQTRPHLEWHINQYIKEIPNVVTLYNHRVKEYIYDADENCISGVIVKNAEQKQETLLADLIVDASGAESFSTKWLKHMEFDIPHEKVSIGLTYVSKFYTLPENKDRDWSIQLVYPNPPSEKIGGTISRVEGNRYIVTLIGYENEIDEKEVISNIDGFLELTKKLPKQNIYDEIKAGTSISDTSIFRVPQIIWKRYEKVKNLPKGLLLIGDTICRIDPVFGQGMSIAVLEALSLQKLLKENKPLYKTVTRFHRKAASIISPIWNMVITEDFRYPGISGKKPIGLPFQQWYSRRIFLLSSRDSKIYDSFIKVMNLVKPITILMHPKIVLTVLMDRIFSKK